MFRYRWTSAAPLAVTVARNDVPGVAAPDTASGPNSAEASTRTLVPARTDRSGWVLRICSSYFLNAYCHRVIACGLSSRLLCAVSLQNKGFASKPARHNHHSITREPTVLHPPYRARTSWIMGSIYLILLPNSKYFDVQVLGHSILRHSLQSFDGSVWAPMGTSQWSLVVTRGHSWSLSVTRGQSKALEMIALSTKIVGAGDGIEPTWPAWKAGRGSLSDQPLPSVSRYLNAHSWSLFLTVSRTHADMLRTSPLPPYAKP